MIAFYEKFIFQFLPQIFTVAMTYLACDSHYTILQQTRRLATRSLPYAEKTCHKNWYFTPPPPLASAKMS